MQNRLTEEEIIDLRNLNSPMLEQLRSDLRRRRERAQALEENRLKKESRALKRERIRATHERNLRASGAEFWLPGAPDGVFVRDDLFGADLPHINVGCVERNLGASFSDWQKSEAGHAWQVARAAQLGVTPSLLVYQQGPELMCVDALLVAAFALHSACSERGARVMPPPVVTTGPEAA